MFGFAISGLCTVNRQDEQRRESGGNGIGVEFPIFEQTANRFPISGQRQQANVGLVKMGSIYCHSGRGKPEKVVTLELERG